MPKIGLPRLPAGQKPVDWLDAERTKQVRQPPVLPEFPAELNGMHRIPLISGSFPLRVWLARLPLCPPCCLLKDILPVAKFRSQWHRQLVAGVQR